MKDISAVPILVSIQNLPELCLMKFSLKNKPIDNNCVAISV